MRRGVAFSREDDGSLTDPTSIQANKQGTLTGEQHDLLRLTSGSKRPAVIKSIIVNGKRFDISGRAYNAMIEGEVYRIYYMPLSRKILSMEAISPE